MTLELDYPSDEEIIEFAGDHGLDEVDVLRDIARLVAVHQMVTEKGYLNDDCVLCGGLAMRLYGSPRFTIMDTDVSYRLDEFHEIELVQALTIEGEVEDLDITPADPSYWEQKRKLVTAQPIRFTQTFSTIQTPPALTRFKLTGSRRGPYLPAVWRPLTHDYTPFGIEDVEVPLMSISEQLAEKIIGWAVSGLLKHYLDAAWRRRRIRSRAAAAAAPERMPACRTRVEVRCRTGLRWPRRSRIRCGSGCCSSTASG